MRKRIASALLTLVMLLSLIPAMGTTAAAAGGSHPTAVGELKKDSEAYYYGFYSDGTVMILGSASANNSKTAEENWDDFKKKIGTPYDNGRTINGVAYYDQDSGTLYVKGCFAGTCTQVTPSTSWSDVLTVVVDGDTIGGSGWYVDEAKKCLKKLNIEFRNNSTLTFTKLDKDNKTATILGVTGHEIKGDPRYGNRPVYNTGDLALTGSGTLKIDIPNHAGALYCIRARNVSIADNVSLDIKTAGNTYTTAHGSETTVRSAAIYCWEKLNIDTTGTVNIVAEKAKLKPNESDRGSFNAFSFYENSIDGNFNLVNAQSVTLNVVDKEDTFINDKGVYQSGWYNTVKSTAEANGWTVTESEETAKPSYTVTMTPAGLSDAVLNVGTQEIPRTSAVTKGEIQASSDNQSLSIAVKAPKWLTTLYNANRVGYNCTAAVYENGSEIFKKVNFNLTTGGSSDGTSTVGLTLTGDFKPTAGKSYIVTFSITPKVKATGEKLESAAISGNWLLTAVEKKAEITSVNLTGDALTEGATSGPNLTSSDTSYTFTQSAWNPSGSIAAGKEYYTTLTLTAKDGYVFPTDWAQLRSIISVKLGGKTITNLGLGLANGGKTLSLTVYATADHNHSWGEWQKDADGHYRECSTCQTVSDKEAHNWGNWTNIDEDTEKRTCGTCGYEETRAKPERPISFLKINIKRPEAGATPSASDLTIRDAYTDQVDIVANSVGWYDESGSPVTGAFEKGKSYTIKAQFTPKGERIFADTITTAGLFFTIGETKTLSADKKIVDYSCTFTAYESVTVDTALPTLKVGEAMPLPTVPDGRTYTVNILYSAGAGSLLSLSYDSTESKWKSGSADATEEEIKVKADTVYVYSYTIKQGTNEKVTANLTDTGNSITSDATGNWVTASYDTSSMNKITSVDLSVTAPEYGKAPVTNATVPTGANYSAGTPEWSPAVTDGKFGADTYTVKIPVTAATSYSFAAGCVYTVNGYSATYADGKVSYTFPALTAPHEHTYGAWTRQDDSYHSRTCNAGDDIQTAAHTWSSWTTVDGNTHKRSCTVEGCDAEQTANHNWVFHSQTDATFDAPGKTVYKCKDNCGVANKEEPIAQLVKIDVENLTVAKPVKDVAAAEATTTDTAYYVAATEWAAADGTTLAIGDKFKPGTVYTVKITLETAGDGVFSAASAYNQIAGKTAMVSPALTGDGYTDTVILTYTFDATEGAYVPTAPSISTATLPDGKVGEAYNQLLSANGSAPITWSVESGALPDGLTLVGDTIKGTPSKAGNFTFTVKATNAGGSDTKELTIKITDTEAAKYHKVTITGAGTGATGAGSHAAGTTVNIYAGTKSGYTFDGWTSDDVTILSASSKNASFVMPDKAVTVKANWTYNGGGSGGYTYYTIKATAGVNGSISPSGNVSVREGRDQTFTITPDKGYAVARVLIDSKNVGAVKSYTFENVKKDHTIEVVFMKAGGNPQTGVFVDVPEDSYYEDAVNWAVENGITTGTDATHFTPDGICTRAQSVTFLWRAAGSPAPKSTTMPFTDVKAGSYYYDAVLWAVENGITKGTSATEFSPAQNCSRAQIVTFLWRSEKSPAAGTVNPFTDVKPEAYYADAVLWAVKEDVTKGTTATTFSPNANCTRAQIVTFIWRALAE